MIELDAITVADLERDPYPIYAELRALAPAVKMPCLDVWMVTRWADVESACNDPAAFPAHVENSPTDRTLGGVSMMTTDGEEARRRRRPFDPTLRPRAIDATMPPVFAQVCGDRLDALARMGGGADLVHDYFEPVSVRSLAHLMGIAHLVDDPTLTRWFAALAGGVSNYEGDPAKTARCDAAVAEIEGVLLPEFERKEAAPDESLISHLLRGSEGTFEERIALALPSFKLVLLGGLQEPAHGSATVTERLLAHPDQLAAVRADPTRIPAAVEEGLRWTAPIGNLLRGIAPGTSLGGMELPAGERAILIVASANRDREIWGPTADDFDIARPKRGHLAFATGPHFCIGHAFARSQLAASIGMLLERFPNLRADPAEPAVYGGHEYRSPKSLRVVLD